MGAGNWSSSGYHGDRGIINAILGLVGNISMWLIDVAINILLAIGKLFLTLCWNIITFPFKFLFGLFFH